MSTTDTMRALQEAAMRQGEREARAVEEVLQAAVGTGMDVVMVRDQGQLERHGDQWIIPVTLRFALIHPGDVPPGGGVVFRVSEVAGVRS